MWVALWDKGTWYWCGSTSGETAAEVAHHSVYHLPASPDDATERARLERENARLREALEDVAEHLAISLDRLGCCGEGDGKDRKADNDSWGGVSALNRAKEAINDR